MGILNVTPDSFFDGGRHVDLQRALDAAHALVADGADMVDVGGESTRPGAREISVDEELQRVLRVVQHLAGEGIAVSVDTSKPAVMRAAIAAGAAMINDVRALRVPGALDAVAASDVGVCLMHMQGEPATMQRAPHYTDVVAEVRQFLLERSAACLAAGIEADRIVIDPGFGFGKTVAHNVALLHDLQQLAGTRYPVLAGWSRKSSLAQITGRATGDDRLVASVTAAVACVARGASWVRVHDVRATVDALSVWRAAERGVWPDRTAAPHGSPDSYSSTSS
jgi:dihydropteroate synthase